MSAFDQQPDDRLVALAQAEGSRDTRPFEALVGRYQGFVAANCRVITRSAADAEDLAQEVFVKAFFALRRFEGRAQFRTWLQRIKVNHCLNHLRKTRGATLVDIDDETTAGHEALQTAPTAEERLEAADARDLILRVLDAMSDTLRVPLMLRDGDGLSYEDIAEQLGTGLSAVKMRIKRAREEFRTRFAAAQATTAPPRDTVAS